MESIIIKPIGVVRSPFTEIADMPIQPVGAAAVEGSLVIDAAYGEGLRDIEGFSHVYVLYYFHKAPRTELTVIPFMDTVTRGVFSTRSPLRPAHIGMSVVELVRVEGTTVHIRGCDMLDSTPIIDIKPYISKFDMRPDATSGWMQASADTVRDARSDARFR